jgi:hypothetical protein
MVDEQGRVYNYYYYYYRFGTAKVESITVLLTIAGGLLFCASEILLLCLPSVLLY